MPSRKLVPTYTKEDILQIHRLGLEFDNITYPSDRIVGHVFTMSKRGDINSTVLDMGIASSIGYQAQISGGNLENFRYESGEYLRFGPTFQAIDDQFDVNLLELINPRFYIESSPTGGTHLEFVGKLTPSDDYTETYGFDHSGGGELRFSTNVLSFLNSTSDPGLPRLYYTSSFQVQPRTQQSAFSSLAYPIFNQSYSNASHIVTTQRQINDVIPEKDHQLVVLKNYIKPYGNLEAIEYIPLSSNVLTLEDSQKIVNGDVFITNFVWLNAHKVSNEGRGTRTNATQIARV